jgi:serine phosphatase RsbU (regulator of sigma subunit)
VRIEEEEPNTEWERFRRMQTQIFSKTPPAKYRFRNNKRSIRNRNWRSTLSQIIEENDEESLEKLQGTKHSSTQTEKF